MTKNTVNETERMTITRVFDAPYATLGSTACLQAGARGDDLGYFALG